MIINQDNFLSVSLVENYEFKLKILLILILKHHIGFFSLKTNFLSQIFYCSIVLIFSSMRLILKHYLQPIESYRPEHLVILHHLVHLWYLAYLR